MVSSPLPSLSSSSTTSSSSTSSLKCHHLVLDTAPFIHQVSLFGYSHQYYTIPEVIQEIKDSQARKYVDQLPFHLHVVSPSPTSIAKAIERTKATGDYPSLSLTDIKVVALTIMLHEQHHSSSLSNNGLSSSSSSSSSSSGLGQDQQERKDDDEDTKSKRSQQQEEEKEEEEEKKEEHKQPPPPSTTSSSWKHLPGFVDDPSDPDLKKHATASTYFDTDDDDDDDGTWISMENLEQSKQWMSGLVPATDAARTLRKQEEEQEEEGVPEVACMTADFAIQNALLQMHLPLVSIKGYRVKALKNWLLRCHACFTTTMNMEKQFCPKCGNPTLLRTSYSIEHGQLHLHLKKHFHYRLRGTKYTVPTTHGNNPALILREDQKEYQVARKQYQRHLHHLSKASADTSFGVANTNTPAPGQGGGGAVVVPPVVGYGRGNPNVARRGRRRR